MIPESATIIAILVLILVVFLRRKNYQYALSTISLMVVPFGYIVSVWLSKPLSKAIVAWDRNDFIFAGVIISTIVSCIMIGLMSTKIHNKKLKIIYFLIYGSFVAVLTIMYFNCIATGEVMMYL